MGTKKQKATCLSCALTRHATKFATVSKPPRLDPYLRNDLNCSIGAGGDIPYEVFETALIEQAVKYARTSLQSMHAPPSPMPALYSQRLTEMDEDIAKRTRDVMSQLQRSDACRERRLERDFAVFNHNLAGDHSKRISEAIDHLCEDSTLGQARDKAIVLAITDNLHQLVMADKRMCAVLKGQCLDRIDGGYQDIFPNYQTVLHACVRDARNRFDEMRVQ